MDKYRQSPLTIGEADERLAAFAAMEAALAKVEPAIPAERRDAFYELLAYPVRASAAANRRFFSAEAHDRLRDSDLAEATRRGRIAHEADSEIDRLTAYYNRELAGGKWRGIMAVEPADGQWRSYRQTPVILPPIDAPVPPAGPAKAQPAAPVLPLLTPDRFAGWTRVEGLGRHGAMLAPGTKAGASRATIDLPPGEWTALVDILPTYADRDGDALHLTVGIDGVTQALESRRETGSRDWAMGVLDNRATMTITQRLSGGRHVVTLERADPGVLIEAVRFVPATAEKAENGLH